MIQRLLVPVITRKNITIPISLKTIYLFSFSVVMVRLIVLVNCCCVSSWAGSVCPEESLSEGAMWWTHLVGRRPADSSLQSLLLFCLNSQVSPLKLTDSYLFCQCFYLARRDRSFGTAARTCSQVSEGCDNTVVSGAGWRAEPAAEVHECSVFWGTLPAYRAYRGFLPGVLQSSL